MPILKREPTALEFQSVAPALVSQQSTFMHRIADAGFISAFEIITIETAKNQEHPDEQLNQNTPKTVPLKPIVKRELTTPELKSSVQELISQPSTCIRQRKNIEFNSSSDIVPSECKKS